MKIFLKSFILFILPLLIICFFTEKSLREIPNEYSLKKDYLDKHSNQIETLFLGNSHVYFGLNPKYIKSNSFNSAQVSQSLDFDLKIFKKYKKRWKKLKFIVIPVDYFSLYSNLGDGIESWREKNYYLYFDIKSNTNILEKFEIFNYKLKNNYHRLSYFYFEKKSTISCSKYGWGINDSSKQNRDLLLSGITTAKRHTAKNDLLFNFNKTVLREIIELAKENNTTVILVTSPTYRSYFENLDNKQLNKTLNEIVNIEHSFHNVKYFNFLKNLSFNKEDFYDADHLNEIGAKKWTLKIDSIINLETNKN